MAHAGHGFGWVAIIKQFALDCDLRKHLVVGRTITPERASDHLLHINPPSKMFRVVLHDSLELIPAFQKTSNTVAKGVIAARKSEIKAA